MKKLFSMLLALALVLSLAVPGFADATTLGDAANKEIEVKGKYTATSTTVNTIQVSVSWTSMDFTYKVAGTKTWNPTEKKYDETTENTWEVAEGAGEITVTNDSDVAVKAAFEFTAEESASGVTMTFGTVQGETFTALTNSAITLKAHPNAVSGQTGSEHIGNVTAKPSGVLDDSFDESAKIGTIKVMISTEKNN